MPPSATPDSIRLVTPFPESAWPSLFAWIKHEIEARVLDDFAPTDIDSFVDLMGNASYQSWAVERDGEIGGFICFRETNPVAGTCWFIFRPRFLEAAPAAIEAAVQSIFAARFERVVFLPFDNNGWAVKLLKDMGAVREGTLRASTRRGGRSANQYVMSILRGEVKYYGSDCDSSGNSRSLGSGELLRQQAEA